MGEFDYSTWYETHREDLNASRRAKYANDEEHRAKVRARNQQYRDRRRTEKAQQLELIQVKADKGWQVHDQAVDPTGEVIRGRFFSVGALAKALGVSVQTVWNREKKGVLEPTPYRTTNGDRLYTESQIAEAAEACGAKKVRKRSLASVRARVRMGDGELKYIRLYRVGMLAQVLSIRVSWLRRMIRRGYLPETPFRSQGQGHRLYSYEMIQAVHTIHDAMGRIRGLEAWGAFCSRVQRAWEDLGVTSEAHLHTDQGVDHGRQEQPAPGGVGG